MSNTSIGYFFDSDSKKRITLEDGTQASVYAVGVSYRHNKLQRDRLTGPRVKNKTEFEKAKKRVVTEEDTIETAGNDELKVLKIKMLTAENRVKMAVRLIPEHLLSVQIIGSVIDKAKQIHPLIFSEPGMDFNPAEIVSQVLGIPVEMLKSAPPVQSQSMQMVPVPTYQRPVHVQKLQPVIEEVQAEEVQAVEVANKPSHPLVLSEEAQAATRYNTMMNRATKFTIDKNGNLKYTECDPTADFLNWFMANMPATISPHTKKVYKCVVTLLVRYFTERALIEVANGETPSLLHVNGKPWLPFTALQDKQVFYDMQAWMFRKGTIKKAKKGSMEPDTFKEMKPTTVKTYMGFMAASFKKAAKCGLIPDTMNPHGEGGYTMPTPDKVDRALTIEELKLLWNYIPQEGGKGGRKVKYTEKLVLDYFFISYFSNGMNLCDIARLRWHQVYFEDRYFKFVRSKIRHRKNTFETVRVDITQELQQYMERYCTRDLHPENYVFPILTPKRGPNGEYLHLLTGDESTEERDRIIQEELNQKDAHIGGMNRILKQIAKKLGIKGNLTTYYARHTLANELAEAGMSVDGIMKRLGQTSYSSYTSYNNRRRYESECKVSRDLFNRLSDKMVKV
jgi:integrase